MKTQKKAQSHVEMIISFILFVGVLMFIFIFINPFSKTEENFFDIRQIKNKIIENASQNIGKLSVIINTDSNTDSNTNFNTNPCYYFKKADDSHDYLDANYIEIADSKNPRKYTIYFSKMFEENLAPNEKKDCDKNNFRLASYSEETIIFYEKIVELKNNYETDYNVLKKNLEIKSDFLFNFKYFNGTEIPELSVVKKTPAGLGKKSEDIPVRMMNKSANIAELMLNINIW